MSEMSSVAGDTDTEIEPGGGISNLLHTLRYMYISYIATCCDYCIVSNRVILSGSVYLTDYCIVK